MVDDFPKTLLELEQRFATDEQCRAYLAALRWPEGFVCPSCGGRKAWPAQRGRLICAACRHQATVTAGTILQDSRLPLQLWCRAIWHVTSQKNGASALGLQRVLGLGSHQTAWIVLNKLRRAMVRLGRDKLSGRVEVEETPDGVGRARPNRFDPFRGRHCGHDHREIHPRLITWRPSGLQVGEPAPCKKVSCAPQRPGPRDAWIETRARWPG